MFEKFKSTSGVGVGTIEKDDTPHTKANVVFFNDDTTTMEFVMSVLIGLFGKTIEEASALTMKIHHNGQSTIATYEVEIAMTKKMEVDNASRNAGYPLRCEIYEI